MAKIDWQLNDCIERMRAGATLEECLERYPENASTLKELLETVGVAMSLASLRPRPEFRSMAKARVLIAARQGLSQKQRQARGQMWHRAWVPMAASVFTLMIIGSGTVAASASALPGEPLYPVKRTVERTQIALTPSEVGKAKLLATFADRRVKEMGDMVMAGRSQDIEDVSVSLARDLEQIKSAIGPRNAEREKPKPDDAKDLQKAAAPAIAAAGAAPPRAVTPEPASERTLVQDGPKKPEPEDEIDVKDAKNPDDVRKALRQSAERQKKYLEGLLEKASQKDRAALVKAIERVSRAYEEASREDGGSRDGED